MDTPEYLKGCIADAPPLCKTPPPDDLLGWWTNDGYYICADCAGRIMARGCRLDLHGSPEPAYEGQPFGVCATCDAQSPTKHVRFFNVHRGMAGYLEFQQFTTKEAADCYSLNRIACVRMEFLEGDGL